MSASIHLDVEPSASASITNLQVQPKSITFETAGQKGQLRVWGVFSDGSSMDITNASATSYSSGDTSAVTVSSTGMVTALGPGKYGVSPVVVHYGNKTFAVQVSTQRVPQPSH